MFPPDTVITSRTGERVTVRDTRVPEMTIPFLLILAGIGLLTIAMIGGGLKAKDVDIPRLSNGSRALCGTASVALIVIGLSLSQRSVEPVPPVDPAKPVEIEKGPVTKPQSNISTTCRYTSGPKAGKTHYFPPTQQGLVPAFVGSPCMDGQGNSGVAVPDGTPADD